jgi:hypothetical protein
MQKTKTDITMKGQEVLNLMRRTNKPSESKLAANIQILKQQKTTECKESPHTTQY